MSVNLVEGNTMTDNDLLRYSRHIFLPEMDIEGQQKLLNSLLLIITMLH